MCLVNFTMRDDEVDDELKNYSQRLFKWDALIQFQYDYDEHLEQQMLIKDDEHLVSEILQHLDDDELLAFNYILVEVQTDEVLDNDKTMHQAELVDDFESIVDELEIPAILRDEVVVLDEIDEMHIIDDDEIDDYEYEVVCLENYIIIDDDDDEGLMRGLGLVELDVIDDEIDEFVLQTELMRLTIDDEVDDLDEIDVNEQLQLDIKLMEAVEYLMLLDEQ